MAKLSKELVSEYLKCKASFEYYCEKYVLIEIPGGDVNLNLYGKQKELTDLLWKDHTVLVLKTRQTGISTTIQAYCSWLCTFHDNVVVGIISKDGREATDFARSVRSIIDKLPSWMSPGFSKYTEQSFILKNGSKVFSSTVNPNEPSKTLRGKPITFLVIDEAAFVNKLDEAWTAMVPALSTSQKHARAAGVPYGVAIISTPNKTVGIGKWFYDRYTKALSGEGAFKPFIVYWKDIPELANDPEWYKRQCEMFDYDQRKINQELELIFLPASGSFFDEKTCEILQENTKDSKYDIIKLFNGEIWKFSEPLPNRYYIIGVDTASEFGNDKSAVTIWDYESLEQVWEYQGKLPVTDFVKVVMYACAQYSGTIVVENNSYGNQVCEAISNSPYSMMLYKEKIGDNRLKPGVTTNAKTRPLMIDALYSYIVQFPQIVKSKRLAMELIGLVTKPSGKVEGDEGCNDDLALTVAFGMYVRKYDPPLMIEYGRNNDKFLEDIVGMNYSAGIEKRDSFSNAQSIDDLNARIMKIAREEANSMTSTFVNTIGLIRG